MTEVLAKFPENILLLISSVFALCISFLIARLLESLRSIRHKDQKEIEEINSVLVELKKSVNYCERDLASQEVIVGEIKEDLSDLRALTIKIAQLERDLDFILRKY